MHIDVQGAGTRLEEKGSGQPVLFLHGNPDTGEVWDGVLAGLPAGLRCLVPDLPGFGGSEAPPKFDFGLEAQAGWVGGVLDAARVSGPVDLVVHDVGGAYGLSFVVRHPERVRRVVIFNTSFDRDYRWHPWARVWRTPLLGELSMAAMNWPLFAREIRRSIPGIGEDRLRAMYRRITPTAKRAVLQWYRAANPERLAGWDEQLRQRLAERPSLVLWGDRDPYIPARFAERFGAREVRRFAEHGHWLMVERPEIAAAAIGGFLRA
jgi:pimeloyl-ACP methyl ester carboxylesterase